VKDKLLKFRTNYDLRVESFDNRTICVRNIPDSIKEDYLVEAFSQIGSVVGVELPTYDKELQQLSYKKVELDPYSREREHEKERLFEKAQQTMRERLT